MKIFRLRLKVAVRLIASSAGSLSSGDHSAPHWWQGW
jgi:hypothetical protein